METLPDLRPASTSHVLGPHSLGQSVEWKQHRKNLVFLLRESFHGPTRWGNQLNGNLAESVAKTPVNRGPHSLGQSVEWKLVIMILLKGGVYGPTRWGNQLNGNPRSRYVRILWGPTRWGNQLNGN